MCRWIAWHVKRLARDLQAPQVRLQPGVRVEDVRGDLVEPAGQLHARRRRSSGPQCAASAASRQSASSSGGSTRCARSTASAANGTPPGQAAPAYAQQRAKAAASRARAVSSVVRTSRS